IDDDGVTMKSLRKLQSCIHEEVRKEEAEKQIQLTLDQFF
ncbi:5074_t:CDS:1, partial [Dentiscutata heterogama]